MTKNISNNPLISIIIPVYNGEEFISEAITNVLEQNYPALEIIVINDGSTDNTEAVVKSIETDLKYFYKNNEGPSIARNMGISCASGDYIAFLDADDLWPENNINILSEELVQNTEVDIVRGYAQIMKKNDLAGIYENVGDPRLSFPAFIGAALYRKEVFDKVGLFDTSLHFGEDSDWYMRATEFGVRMKWLDRVTLHVRRHGNNMTEGKDLIQLNTLRVFKKAVDRLRIQENRTQENQS
ncbi:MAG: glycosyltransferase [Saprospiraceae bacterium]|nr:glycosyltransferase [Saprospiraceae bacterium]